MHVVSALQCLQALHLCGTTAVKQYKRYVIPDLFVFRRVRKIAKSNSRLRRVCPSVRPSLLVSARNNSAATERIL